jgi:hypothetical protein
LSIKRASGSAFPCIFSDDFRPTISKAASALHWNICIMFELHGKLQKLERYTRNREYFWTRWKRGKVLCVYSKHNNGKARSREDHGASPSLWKEYYLNTRQTIQGIAWQVAKVRKITRCCLSTGGCHF